MFLFSGCARVEPPERALVNLVPSGQQMWRLHINKAASVYLDGQVVKERKLNILGNRAHRLQINDVTYTLPARELSPCGSIEFIALGDGRAHVDHLGPSAYWPGILSEVYAHQPAFILNTGDLVKRGHRHHEWERFLQQTRVWPPMFTVRGNHDRGGLYQHYMASPFPVSAFTWGPVNVIGFDTEIHDTELQPALNALVQALESRIAPWTVLVLHRPIWSRGTHGSDERGWNRHLVPLIDRYGVDLVLAGHDHNYERTCPMKGLPPATRCMSERGGAVYVVTGGAATFVNPFPGFSRHSNLVTDKLMESTSQVFSGSHHYLKISATGQTLRLQAVRTRVGNVFGGGTMDEFQLKKKSNLCPLQ